MNERRQHVIASVRRPTPTSNCDQAASLARAIKTTVIAVVALLKLAAADFQLSGELGDSAQLPCLIGRQAYCGEPYFIAWYKHNATSKSWTRIEQKAEEEPDPTAARPPGAESGPLSDRVRFDWPRGLSGRRASCPQLLVQAAGASKAAKLEASFDCGQLHIGSLQLADEGQYKCEITFSESLDFDKCPATTLSHLAVIARPKEPELLVNGRAWLAGQQWGRFKEGEQVRLECQSSQGRPAPRIEWLNVSVRPEALDSAGAEERLQVEPMRAHWQQRKPLVGPDGALVPLTSSSASVSLSRFDLATSFVCLVLPSLGAQSGSGHDQLMRSPARLAALLAKLKEEPSQAAAMSRWLRLPLAVKPSSASIIVRDVLANNSRLQLEHGRDYYSVQPNRLYAVQCLVEDSRPKSQVVWYNRTAAMALPALELNTTDYLVPWASSGAAMQAPHRLSSFSRSVEHANGSSSTIATLLITTSVWDNLEEVFCQSSNEAFKFDELIQVAPIRSARLLVQYPPLAWLEALEPSSTGAAPLQLARSARLLLRCTVAANPWPADNTIVQIEWLKDGRKLADQTKAGPLIERANLLHMSRPGQAASQNQLAPGSKLIGSSSLTILQARAADSGAYSCQFRLVPASSPQPARIVAGQANQTIQVNVIEGEPRGPTIRVASSRPALVYGPAAGGRVETVVVEPSAKMSLKCELPWSQSDELGLNKIAWYLNGAYLHSTGSSDTYNLTLPELTRPLGGTYSCAHHLLGSNQAMDSNNFHGAAVRVIHSHNKLDLKARAGPRLLNRRDLLAPVRSFSEPELTSNPAGRLKLTCLAQCEPLCSIDWSIELNEAGLSSRLKIDPFDASSSLSADVNSSRVNRTNFIRVRWLHLDQQESNRNLVIRQLESLTYRQNDTNFSWLSQAVVPNQLDADFRPTADLATGLAPDPVQANVLSRLELTYAQLAKLLLANHASADPVQVKVKCRPSPLLVAGTAKSLSGSVFGYRLIESETYYPTELVEEPSPDDGEPFIRKGAANLTEYLDMVKLQTGSIYSDEMQTSILLDAPPTASGILLVSGLRDPTLEADRLLLSHNQLVEISDPNSLPAPMLTCRYGGHPYPAPQFKWFFTDLNNSEHLLAIEGPQLSLRQFIEFRQRQLGADPMSAYGLELVSSIVGNYSCIVSNSHGSSKASIELLVQDRPLCRLSLAKEYLGPDNELMALLKCTIYSNLPIMEAIWFRRRLQIASNGSDLVDDRLEFARNPHLSELTLPIMVLNKDQKFMLEDMVDHGANFKCLARNLIGYSEGCELNQNDKQTLINTFNTIVVSSKGSPNLPLLPFSDLKQPSILGSPIDFASNASMSSASDSSISISKNTNFISSIRALFHTISSGYLLWLLMLISSLTFAWLVFVLSSSVVRGRFGYLNARKWRSKSIKHTTSWRYNTNRTDVGSDGIGGPFQSSKICINYYGGSNGDSEHDMVQSASQSSHYEDFAAVANHPQPLQSIRSSAGQQPIYLNGNPSLNRRLLKFSHSNTGSGDGGFGHRRNPVARLNQHQANTSTMRHFPAANLVPSQADLSATMRDTCSQPSHMSASRPPGEVPLINGARRSKIDLEQQPRYLVGSGPEQVPVQPQIKLNMDQQTFSSQLRNEQHIYDDVIYNQMIM